MNSDRVESLFARASNLPQAARKDFLQRECEDNALLRNHVEALLAAHDQPATALASLDFLPHPPSPNFPRDAESVGAFQWGRVPMGSSPYI